MSGTVPLPAFDFHQRTRLVYGPGSLQQLPDLVREYGGSTVLLVTDAGLQRVGHGERAERVLKDAGVTFHVYDRVEENPDSSHVDALTQFARPLGIDMLIGLGGGSSLDCAKGANFLLTNGGRIHDYKGIGRAAKPMLPMLAIPTTSGTGSEAQSFAVIADAETHLKMACGDVKAACKVALLDPELTLTMPRRVTAATGIDAMTHAIESYVSTKRNSISQMFAHRAWQLLSHSFGTVLEQPDHLDARGGMQVGAFLAGAAIENSMLGAAHATANPLTARFGTTHGHAVGLMLPHVIRWNAADVDNLYADLAAVSGWSSAGTAGDTLAAGFTKLLLKAGMPTTVAEVSAESVTDQVIRELAEDAAQQWTGTFNPRKMNLESFLQLYTNARS